MFAGLGGWSGAFLERGHEVVTTDFDPRFGCTVTGDILDEATLTALIALGPYDVVLASPPCEGFTVMNIGKNWHGEGCPEACRATHVNHSPKTDSARLAQRIVERTRVVIATLAPTYFIIENPVAKLRKLPVVADLDRRTVTYCRLGETRRKPTDLWGEFPPSLVLPEQCVTIRGQVWTDPDGVPWATTVDGLACHVSAPRGSKTPGSTQGIKGAPSRAEVPIGLSRLVAIAAEADLAAGRAPRSLTLGL